MTGERTQTVEPLTETETDDLDALEEGAPRVGIIMAAKEHRPVMEEAAAVLDEAGVRHELRVLDVHRSPEAVGEYCGNARMRGLRVIIAGSARGGGLAGLAAAHSDLPVVGVPLSAGDAGGPDAVLEVVESRPGAPVACVGLDAAGDAAHLTLRILAA